MEKDSKTQSENPGVALNRIRWAKTTAEERKAIAVELNRIRWSKSKRAKKSKS